MSDIKGSRLLRKQIPYCFVTAETAGAWSITSQGGGWEIYTSTAGAVDTVFAVWRGYFDISGWNSEKLSAFVSGVGWQEAQDWAAGALTVGQNARIRTWDIVTKAMIPNAALDNQIGGALVGYWFPPGFSGSNYDLEEVFAGRYRTFDLSSVLSGGWQQSNQETWGAGDATAGDKIYITRIVYLTNVQVEEGDCVIPPQDIVLPATLASEKDLVYMERLRRSYVLGESRNP